MCATHDWSLFLSLFSPSSSYLSFFSSLQSWKTLTKVSKETLRRCIKIDDLRFDDLREITTFSLPLSLLRGHVLDSWSFIVHLRSLSLSLVSYIRYNNRPRASTTPETSNALDHAPTRESFQNFEYRRRDARLRTKGGALEMEEKKKSVARKIGGHTHTQTRLFGYCLKVHCA